MFVRALFAAVALSACGTSSVAPGLAVDSIEPAAGRNDAPVAVDISGSFHLPVHINFDTGEGTVVLPTASLVGGSLEDVRWQSEQRVSASVPAGLAPGIYDVSVELDGETATLAMGYEVLDSTPPPPPAPFSLTGANFLLPCITNGTPNSRACTCDSSVQTQTKTIEGVAGERWHVTVRVRGVMEQITYTGGTAAGSTGWYVGGTYGGGNNYYGFTVSSPPGTYFINYGPAVQSNSWLFDYEATFDVDAGATLTFMSSGQDGIMWEGVDENDLPISIASVTDPPQPYNGQFARIDVIDAVAF